MDCIRYKITMLDQLGELVIGWNVSELFSVGVKQQKRHQLLSCSFSSIPFAQLMKRLSLINNEQQANDILTEIDQGLCGRIPFSP